MKPMTAEQEFEKKFNELKDTPDAEEFMAQGGLNAEQMKEVEEIQRDILQSMKEREMGQVQSNEQAQDTGLER